MLYLEQICCIMSGDDFFFKQLTHHENYAQTQHTHKSSEVLSQNVTSAQMKVFVFFLDLLFWWATLKSHTEERTRQQNFCWKQQYFQKQWTDLNWSIFWRDNSLLDASRSRQKWINKTSAWLLFVKVPATVYTQNEAFTWWRNEFLK